MKTRRAAYLLAELLVVITLSAVITAIAAVSLQGMVRVQKRTAAAHAHRETTFRLALLLAGDVHAATHVRPLADGDRVDGIELTLPDGQTIEYRSARHTVTRLRRQQDKVIHRDRFSFDSHTQLAWSIDTDFGERVTLTVDPSDRFDRGAGRPLPIRIEATIGVAN